MQLGRYELLEVVGKGGFGVVYRALDTALQVERALKVLHPALIVDPEMASRFKREAQVAAQLEHPHIVPVYDVGEVENRVFLAMKYLSGGSLKERLAEEGPLPYPEALKVLKQIAEGVAFAHQHDIIHRDLKPGNILFDENGQVRVSDFGFAKVLSGTQSATLTMSGGILGTPAYMAPELWNGTPPPSTATDVYAIACVFYEMLTGKVLFEGETPMAVMARHASGPRFDVPDIQSSVNTLDFSCLESALRQDPAERIASPQAFYNLIKEAALGGERRSPSTGEGVPSIARQGLIKSSDEKQPETLQERRIFTSELTAKDNQDRTLTDSEIVRQTPPEKANAMPTATDWKWEDRRETREKNTPTNKLPAKARKNSFVLIAGILSLIFLLCILIVFLSSYTQNKKAKEQAILISSATASANSTATTRANSTATARANSTATARANSTATARANSTATAVAQATATAETAREIFNSYAVAANLAFSESSGVLEHEMDGKVREYRTDVELKNFALEVTFENPYSPNLGGWDYGILFRKLGGGDQYRLILDSDQDWVLINRIEESTTIATGSSSLNTGEGETNQLRLIAIDDVGYFFINNRFISELDLSARDFNGHVSVGTGFYPGNEVEGYSTKFRNLKIYSFDGEQITTTPTSARATTQTSMPPNTISVNSQAYEVTSSSSSYTWYRFDVFFKNTEPWDDTAYSLVIEQDMDYNDYYLCEFDQYKPSPCEFRDHQGITYLYCFEEITMYWKLSEIKCAYDIKLYGSDDSLVYRYRHYHTFEND